MVLKGVEIKARISAKCLLKNSPYTSKFQRGDFSPFETLGFRACSCMDLSLLVGTGIPGDEPQITVLPRGRLVSQTKGAGGFTPMTPPPIKLLIPFHHKDHLES